MNRFFLFLHISLLLQLIKFSSSSFEVENLEAKNIYGEVLNSSDKTKIPYATIIYYNKKKGFNANIDGSFVFDWNGKTDTLHISSVGYYDTLFVLNEETYKSNLEIELRQKSIELEEYKFIYSAEKIKNFATMKSKPSGYFGGMSDKSTEFGLAFTQPEITGGHLMSVSFYIAKAGVIKTPFRIRVYNFDGTKPDKELTMSNIFVTAAKHGWNEFDMSSQNIIISESGCLVSMEWLNISDKYTVYDKNMKEFVHGQKLGLSYIGDEYKGFLRHNMGAWFSNEVLTPKSIIPKNIINNKKMYLLNPMIRITIN